MSKYQALIDALKAGPKKWDYDSNQTPFYNDAEGHSRGGECDGTYCLFGEDFFIEGERYDGPILSERCSKADAAYIAAANPATIRSLLADLERAEKDAERYRWLRATENANRDEWNLFGPYSSPAEIDAAIDAALSQLKGKQ